MAETPTSKSQTRLLKLSSLSCDGTYMNAAATLSAAGLPGDGLPAGQTWRSAGKLSDADLLALLPAAQRVASSVKTTAEVRLDHQNERRDRIAAQSERAADWAASYYEPREEPEYLDNLLPRSVPTANIVDANDVVEA